MVIYNISETYITIQDNGGVFMRNKNNRIQIDDNVTIIATFDKYVRWCRW